MHLPINHRLRSTWRALAGACGALLIAFGAIGVVRITRDSAGAEVFGMRTGPALAWLSIMTGAVVLAGVLIGRNVDRVVNAVAGAGLLLAGLAGLAAVGAGAAVLDFEISTCVVAFGIGALLVTASLYGKVGSPSQAVAEEVLRHGTRPGEKFAVTPHADTGNSGRRAR